MDGQMGGRLDGMNEEKNLPAHRLSLPLIGALISRTPALNGDAGERNTAEANSYHDFCSN